MKPFQVTYLVLLIAAFGWLSEVQLSAAPIADDLNLGMSAYGQKRYTEAAAFLRSVFPETNPMSALHTTWLCQTISSKKRQELSNYSSISSNTFLNRLRQSYRNPPWKSLLVGVQTNPKLRPHPVLLMNRTV